MIKAIYLEYEDYPGRIGYFKISSEYADTVHRKSKSVEDPVPAWLFATLMGEMSDKNCEDYYNLTKLLEIDP